MLSEVRFNQEGSLECVPRHCVFAYNTSRHESIKFTPFELMFGRKATLPIDVELQNASPEEVCQKFHTLDEPNTSAILRKHVQRLETAKQNILVAQLKQKENYDQKHAKPERFQVNQVVLKKDFTRKKTKGGKLKERYLGPYTITKVLPHGTYELADPSDKSKTLRATGAHLKPYTAPSPPHEENISGKGVSKECSEIKDEPFILSPPPEEECPENILPPQDELLDEDELSLNLSIPILPPPMPSLQLLHHAPLPFPPAAPLACSTPRITTPSPSPPPKVKELPKCCIGTKEEERAIVQQEKKAKPQSCRKEHQSQRVDAEEEAETVEGSEESQSD